MPRKNWAFHHLFVTRVGIYGRLVLSGAPVLSGGNGRRPSRGGPTTAGLNCYSSITLLAHRICLYFSIQAGMYTQGMVCCLNEC